MKTDSSFFSLNLLLRSLLISLLSVTGAAALRAWPLQSLGTKTPYLTFYPAVMASSLYGGMPGGILTTAVSGTFILLWHPGGLPFIKEPSDWLGMAVFLINGVFISGISEAMRRSRYRAEAARKEAAEERSRRTDVELKRSEASLNEAQRLARIGSWTWDPASDDPTWSQEMFRIYGMDPSGPPANFKEVPKFFVPEGWEALNAAVSLTYSQGIPYELDTQVVRPDGNRVWVTCRGEAVRDASGRIASLRGTVQDISARMEAESIRTEAETLRHADEMKTKFMANMSHELRTPLNAIIGFSEMLKDGLLGELTDKQRKYIGNIFSSGEHLLSLINDILDLSKIEAGKMTLDLDTVEIQSMLQNSLSMIKEKAVKHHIGLHADIPPDIGSLRCDARKAKQILYNLLSNAVKFTEDEGSITVRARKVGPEMVGRLTGRRPGRSFARPAGEFTEFLEISVADTGIGIPSSGLSQLFQSFSQIDSGLARRYSGTGLGLALVRQMAELHGGTVMIESAEGEGSCFSVWLPCRTEQDVLAVEPAGLGELPSSSGRAVALVVEDDDQAAELVRLQLEMDMISVVRVRTAEAGLDILQNLIPSLITLDILLPGMDGWEFLARIKQIPAVARIPVVIVSIVAEQNKGMSLGAAAVLQKPIGRDDLQAALSSIGFDKPGNNQAFQVLVVDDDPYAVELIASQLRHLNYSVHEAYGGREAIEAAHRLHPDLILLDLMMPEVTGVDVVEEIKSHERTRDIPIVIVTAKILSEDDRRKLNGDVVRIIAKSQFNHGHFINEVRRALGSRKQVEQDGKSAGD